MNDCPFKKGKFISVEGGEGVGKTTNLVFIKERLEAAGHCVVLTREPGGTTLGEKIRGLLLDKSNKQMTSIAELLLIFAARAQHVSEVILPALAQGHWVLSDRFTDASFAYQGAGRGIDGKIIADLQVWALDNLEPDLTLLLDVPPAIGQQRAAERAELDRFEIEKTDFFNRVRQEYLERAKKDTKRFRVIDTNQKIDTVKKSIRNQLDLWLAELNE